MNRPRLTRSLTLSPSQISLSFSQPVQPHPPPPAPSHFLHTLSSVLPKPLHNLPPSNFTPQLSSISQPCCSDSSHNNNIINNNNNTGMCRYSHSLIWISASKLSLAKFPTILLLNSLSPRDPNCTFRIICKTPAIGARHIPFSGGLRFLVGKLPGLYFRD